jgi:hypothetical protein
MNSKQQKALWTLAYASRKVTPAMLKALTTRGLAENGKLTALGRAEAYKIAYKLGV